MKFINFTTDSPDYRVENGNMIWSVANFSLGNDVREFAVSSCLFNFKTTNGSHLPMVLSCSLADENEYNYDGKVCVGISEFKNFWFQAANLEFWRLDCSRPRTVMFALRGVNAETIKFANITLTLR